MREWLLVLYLVGQAPYVISMQLDTKTHCLRVGKAIYLTMNHLTTGMKHPWAVPPYDCKKA